MRAIIFKSQLASDTRRLSATIDVESSQIRFLGGLRLDLWDCGGQDSFMDSHLTAQSSTVFRSVHSLIYIFDAESESLLSSDTHYFLKCLNTLSTQNSTTSSTEENEEEGGGGGGPMVFVLLHKMDLVPLDQQASKFSEFEKEVSTKARESGWKGGLRFMSTSIWNETLYRVKVSSPPQALNSGLTPTILLGLVNRCFSLDAIPLYPTTSPRNLFVSHIIPRISLVRTNNILGDFISDEKG